MQKWEYMTWVVGYPSTLLGTMREHGGGRVKFRDGVELDNWKEGPTLPEALNRAGIEGWELVTIDRGPQERAFTERDPSYIFKRPRQRAFL